MDTPVDNEEMAEPEIQPEVLITEPDSATSNVDLLSTNFDEKVDIRADEKVDIRPDENGAEETQKSEETVTKIEEEKPETERSSNLDLDVPAPTQKEEHVQNGVHTHAHNPLDTDTNYEKLLLTRGQDFDLDYTLLGSGNTFMCHIIWRLGYES